MSKDTRHFLYGDTNESSCVPDASVTTGNPPAETGSGASSAEEPSARPLTSEPRATTSTRTVTTFMSDATGPAYDTDGALVLDPSFKNEPAQNGPDAENAAVSAPVLLEGRRLVDALMLWDAYRNDWALESPLLLRFEDGDVVLSYQAVRTTCGHITWWEGSLDTARPVRILPQGNPHNDEVNDQECLQWAPVPSWDKALGQQVSAARADGRGIDVAFEDAFAHLAPDNGRIEASIVPNAPQ